MGILIVAIFIAVKWFIVINKAMDEAIDIIQGD